MHLQSVDSSLLLFLLQDFYRNLVLETNRKETQRKTTFSNTKSPSPWLSLAKALGRAFGTTAAVMFASCLCASCLSKTCCSCCVSICYQTAKIPVTVTTVTEQELQEVQEQQLQNLQEQTDINPRTRPSQNNTPHGIFPNADSPPPYPAESPPPPYPGISKAAFLPYPNTGIAYQAPSTNPV